LSQAASATILIVPGLRDYVPEHWQTLLEQQLPKATSVPRMERDKLSCATWVAMLNQSLSQIEGPVVLAAHSAGCMIVVHWAQQHKGAIKGALLATPPDFESPLPELSHAGRSAAERLAADAARPPAVPEHRRGEHQRPVGSVRARRGTCRGMGQSPRQPWRRRASQSRGGVRSMAEG